MTTEANYSLSPPLAVESYSGEIKELREARRLLTEQCFRLEEARDLWMRQFDRVNRENAELAAMINTIHAELCPMKFEKPDGIIELGSSGCCCPPGERRPGQHTNSTSDWARVFGGPWLRIHSLSRTKIFAGAANSCAEFLAGMREDT